jgi:hypothetical protein
MMLAAAVGATACEGAAYDANGPVAYCTATRPIAIIVSVRDSITLAARADSATGTVQSGTYVDTLRLYSPGNTTLFGGTQLGTYAVTVQRAGYHTWTRSGVQVNQTGSCGNPVTVSVDALLQPLP